jgi:hypothetical protein
MYEIGNKVVFELSTHFIARSSCGAHLGDKYCTVQYVLYWYRKIKKLRANGPTWFRYQSLLWRHPDIFRKAFLETLVQPFKPFFVLQVCDKNRQIRVCSRKNPNLTSRDVNVHIHVQLLKLTKSQWKERLNLNWMIQRQDCSGRPRAGTEPRGTVKETEQGIPAATHQKTAICSARTSYSGYPESDRQVYTTTTP